MKLYLTIIALAVFGCVHAQSSQTIADDIRRTHNMPELGYAVVSADSILDMHVCGVRKTGTKLTASLSDRFRIGSNTKAVTCYIAATLVKQGKIKWDTRFFDLFPELKVTSNPAYHQLTLLDLLTFRTHLFAWTYTNTTPTKEQFRGNDSMQRYLFTKWFMATEPVRPYDTVCFSNLGYVAAGLMFEKATGHSFEYLVRQLGKDMGIDYDFGQPNVKNTLQTWGHNAELQPEPPMDNYKLNWLLAGGNINATIPSHVRFLQELLKGWQGRSSLLSAAETRYLFQARSVFALGWFADVDKAGNTYYANTGNPGTFLSRIVVYPTLNRALLIFTNVQSPTAEQGIEELQSKLLERWVH